MRYKVNLETYLADCELNYLRLLKVFPRLADKNRRQIGFLQGAEKVVSLKVLERTPYTTLVEISQQKAEPSTCRWLHVPDIKVRVYHDAKVAEVVDCAGLRRPGPRCSYPNRQMHQQDEKAQWNRFLGEWLGQCIHHGYCAESRFEIEGLAT